MHRLSRLALEAIVGSIPAGVVVLEKENGKIVYVNDRAIALYGCDPRGLDMLNHSTKIMRLLTLDGEIYPPEQLPASRALLDGQEASDELIIERPDGSRVIVAASAKAVRNEKGQISAAVGIFEDITGRKKAEVTLKESEQRWATTLASIGDAVIATNAQGTVTFMNAIAEKLTGYNLQEALYKSIKEVFPIVNEYSGQEVESPVDRVLKEGTVVGLANHTVLIHKDGTQVPIDDSGAPIKDSEGKTTGVVLVFHDISKRRKAEENLKKAFASIAESEKLYRSIGELIPFGIWETDPQGGVTYQSQVFFDMVGMNFDEVKQFGWLSRYRPEKVDQFLTDWKRTLQEGTFWKYEHDIKDKDGNWQTMLSRGFPIRNENGKITKWVGINVDITDLKRAQKALEKRTLELECAQSMLKEYANKMEALAEQRANQLKNAERLAAIGQTAGMVGHDLRNPLQSIVGEVYLAQNELSSIPDSAHKACVQESVQAISEQIGYMDKIVSDLQVFVKPIDVHKQTVELKRLITATLTQVTAPQNIHASLHVEETITVEADPHLLKRVLINLITNAVQAMPQGGELTISAQITHVGKVQIAVEDTGTGIAEEIKPKLFTPLFTTKSKGQGFGLAACRRFLEAQGGSISFESEEGKGSKFIVELSSK